GILAAVTLSLLDVIARISRPHDAVLGHLRSIDAYVGLDRGGSVREEPRLVVYRFDAPLFFANAAYFRERVQHLIERADPPVRCFLFDAQAVTSLDATADDTLSDLLDDLDRRGIRFILARANGTVRDALRRSGLARRIGRDGLFPTVRAGVRAYREGEHLALHGNPVEPDDEPAYPRNATRWGMSVTSE